MNPVFGLILCAGLEHKLVCAPISPEKHGAGAAAARRRTAVPAGTPQEGHTAHLDISPVGMAQADPRGGTKGPGRPL